MEVWQKAIGRDYQNRTSDRRWWVIESACTLFIKADESDEELEWEDSQFTTPQDRREAISLLRQLRKSEQESRYAKFRLVYRGKVCPV